MKRAAFNYVRAFRQRHGLTARDLSFLINQRSHTFVSLIEGGWGAPPLAGALALQVLFGQQPRQLFPGLYESIEDSVMRRASVLLRRLEGRQDRRSVAKREFLESLASREASEEEP